MTETDQSPGTRGGIAPGASIRRLRAIWISDVHLGTPGCQADYLLDFLTHHDAERIFLVGDIIDGWQLRKDWYWNDDQQNVVMSVLEKARQGARVVFVPGNHDEFAREFVGMSFDRVSVQAEASYTTLSGKRLWITHGDQYDGVVQHAKWLALLGDSLYVLALRLNHRFNRIRSRLGMGYWSLSQYLKHKVKNAVTFIDAFESTVTSEARRRGYDGVVCGHIHKAEIRTIDGSIYANCGDWVESLTALVENHAGQLELVHWPRKQVSTPGALATPVRPAAQAKPTAQPVLR